MTANKTDQPKIQKSKGIPSLGNKSNEGGVTTLRDTVAKLKLFNKSNNITFDIIPVCLKECKGEDIRPRSLHTASLIFYSRKGLSKADFCPSVNFFKIALEKVGRTAKGCLKCL